jgi:hypothetical protein
MLITACLPTDIRHGTRRASIPITLSDCAWSAASSQVAALLFLDRVSISDCRTHAQYKQFCIPDAASRELSLMHDRQATIDFGTHLLTVSGWMIESAP